jgi:putative NADH-flavin reductase
MKIALFGASGMVGQRILHEALQRGHEVTAIVRDPTKITEKNPHLKTVKGDQNDAAAVAKLVAGHHAVVTAFSPAGNAGADALVKATRSLIEGVKQSGVKRLVMVGGAGSLEVAPGVQLVDTPQFPASYRQIAIDHRDALDVMRKEAAGLQWTNFSPPAIIEPGQRTGKFRTGTDQLIADAQGNSRISAEDFAVALMDEVDNPKHIGARFTAAY